MSQFDHAAETTWSTPRIDRVGLIAPVLAIVRPCRTLKAFFETADRWNFLTATLVALLLPVAHFAAVVLFVPRLHYRYADQGYDGLLAIVSVSAPLIVALLAAHHALGTATLWRVARLGASTAILSVGFTQIVVIALGLTLVSFEMWGVASAPPAPTAIIHSAWSRFLREIIVAGFIVLPALWAYRAVSFLGVPAELPADVAPPLCEGCGYDLRHLPESGRCPECGMNTDASLDPHRSRPGVPWEQRATVGNFLATLIQLIGRPRRFYRTIRTRGDSTAALSFAGVILLPTTILSVAAGAWLDVYLVTGNDRGFLLTSVFGAVLCVGGALFGAFLFNRWRALPVDATPRQRAMAAAPVAIALVLIFGGIAWLCNVTVAYTDAPMLYSLSDMLSRASGPFTVLFAIIMLLVSGGAMLRSRPPRRRNLSKLFSYEIVLLPLFWLLTPSLIVFIWSVNSLSAAVAAGALLFAVAIYRARVLLTATRYANF